MQVDVSTAVELNTSTSEDYISTMRRLLDNSIFGLACLDKLSSLLHMFAHSVMRIAQGLDIAKDNVTPQQSGLMILTCR